MRLSDSVSYRNLLDNISMLEARIEKANQEIASGNKLLQLHAAPAGSAEMVQLNDQLAQLDLYQTNADTSSYYMQVSENTLNSVYDLVAAIYTRGSAAANSFTDANARATLAAEIRSQRDQILSLANTKIRDRYVFAGSNVDSAAYTISGDTATYQGNLDVNKISVGRGAQVDLNIPGSTAFDRIFTTVQNLLAAVDSGDVSSIQSALGQFAGTLGNLSQVRARLGVGLAKLQDTQVSIQAEQTNIQTRQSRIGDVDMAEAITELRQAQTALQAALTAGSMVNETNLFDYLG